MCCAQDERPTPLWQAMKRILHIMLIQGDLICYDELRVAGLISAQAQ